MMEFLKMLADEVLGFFSVDGLLEIICTGNYASLRTWDGITRALAPLIPLIVVIEMTLAFAHQRLRWSEYRIPFFIYVFNRIAGRFISLGVVSFCIGLFQPFAPFQAPATWYGFIYGYVVWEFAHFIYHYLGHKVRLFWCLHSTHHAPVTMNLSVTYSHFILEAPYADLIRTSICILAGVSPVMLFAIMFIDGTWGGFIHVGENFMKDARFGVLGRFILTPSHHRVHHARNPLYMDQNFCNLLNVWDRIFRTYQPELQEHPPEYGITRGVNPTSFWDVYFGEFAHLFRDMAAAPGLLNKLKYIVMPPGWSHTGLHRTARVVRQQYLGSDQPANR